MAPTPGADDVVEQANGSHLTVDDRPTATTAPHSSDDDGRSDATNVLRRQDSTTKHDIQEHGRFVDRLDTPDDKSKPSSACPSEREEQPEDDDQQQQHIVVSFEDDDPLNPYNWSLAKKLYVTITCSVLVMNSTISSALPTGATAEVSRYFNVRNQALLVLPVSIFLVGYVLGPLVFPPLSESFGRKTIMAATFFTYTVFTLACALAPNFASLIVFRLLVGISASTPVSVIGGTYADIWGTPKARGRSITGFMTATTWGPLLGPIISGFVSPVSWRWTYWCSLIIAGATWIPLVFMPETYGPVLLRSKARKLRQETGDQRIVAPVELEKLDLRELVVVVLTRPVRMFLFEAIVLCSCLYLSLVYGIFYIYFQAYPIIYEGTYGFSAGEEGLAFLPVGIGAVIACVIYLYWEHYLEKAKARDPVPEWAQKEEYLRLPLACLGGPLFAIACFWLGWSARPDVHWIVPTLSAIPWGIGFLLLFMSLVNYVVDAYEIFAASAMGATSASRSVFGVVLPFAAKPMYEKLGVAWACSLLGFLSLGMCVIPFVFIKYGDRIRANSEFCLELKARKEEAERKREEQHRHRQRKGGSQGEKTGGGVMDAIPVEPEKQV